MLTLEEQLKELQTSHEKLTRDVRALEYREVILERKKYERMRDMWYQEEREDI